MLSLLPLFIAGSFALLSGVKSVRFPTRGCAIVQIDPASAKQTVIVPDVSGNQYTTCMPYVAPAVASPSLFYFFPMAPGSDGALNFNNTMLGVLKSSVPIGGFALNTRVEAAHLLSTTPSADTLVLIGQDVDYGGNVVARSAWLVQVQQPLSASPKVSAVRLNVKWPPQPPTSSQRVCSLDGSAVIGDAVYVACSDGPDVQPTSYTHILKWTIAGNKVTATQAWSVFADYICEVRGIFANAANEPTFLADCSIFDKYTTALTVAALNATSLNVVANWTASNAPIDGLLFPVDSDRVVVDASKQEAYALIGGFKINATWVTWSTRAPYDIKQVSPPYANIMDVPAGFTSAFPTASRTRIKIKD